MKKLIIYKPKLIIGFITYNFSNISNNFFRNKFIEYLMNAYILHGFTKNSVLSLLFLFIRMNGVWQTILLVLN